MVTVDEIINTNDNKHKRIKGAMEGKTLTLMLAANACHKSVEHSSRMQKIVGSNPWSGHTNHL